MRFHAEAVDKIAGDVNCSDKSSFVVERCVPQGVVAAVVPWSISIYVAIMKISLAVGAAFGLHADVDIVTFTGSTAQIRRAEVTEASTIADLYRTLAQKPYASVAGHIAASSSAEHG